MAYREIEKTQIRAWMREVLAAKDWTPAHWAGVAGTSPTNITRFLKDGIHVPSTRTLAKLSNACGSWPQIGPQFERVKPAERRVPHWSEREAVAVLLHEADPPEQPKKKAVSTMIPVSEGAFAVTVSSRAMELRGIVPGDILICEPVAIQKPKEGGVVLYATNEKEKLEIGVWQDPWIIHHTSEAMPAIKSVDATIVAVALDLRRAL